MTTHYLQLTLGAAAPAHTRITVPSLVLRPSLSSPSEGLRTLALLCHEHDFTSRFSECNNEKLGATWGRG